MSATATRSFGGRQFLPEELCLIREVVTRCAGLSREELAQTVCELLEWRRPSGGLKARECRDLLEQLEEQGWLELPSKRAGRPRGLRTEVPVTAAGDPHRSLVGTVRDFGPVLAEAVEDEGGNRLFRELVGRHHYLGYRVPFGLDRAWVHEWPRPHGRRP
jgi:hypothetical protein